MWAYQVEVGSLSYDVRWAGGNVILYIQQGGAGFSTAFNSSITSFSWKIPYCWWTKSSQSGDLNILLQELDQHQLYVGHVLSSTKKGKLNQNLWTWKRHGDCCGSRTQMISSIRHLGLWQTWTNPLGLPLFTRPWGTVQWLKCIPQPQDLCVCQNLCFCSQGSSKSMMLNGLEKKSQLPRDLTLKKGKRNRSQPSDSRSVWWFGEWFSSETTWELFSAKTSRKCPSDSLEG